MKKEEIQHYHEYGPTGPEQMPQPSEYNFIGEYNEIIEMEVNKEIFDDEEYNTKINKDDDKQKKQQNNAKRNTSSNVLNFVAVTVSAAVIVSTASVLSEGTFFPEIAKATTTLYEKVANIPVVDTPEGMDMDKVVSNWNKDSSGNSSNNNNPNTDPLEKVDPVPEEPTKEDNKEQEENKPKEDKPIMDVPPVAFVPNTDKPIVDNPTDIPVEPPVVEPPVEEVPPEETPEDKPVKPDRPVRPPAPSHTHNWDVGAVTKAPTCGATGIMTFTCQDDPSHTKTETIPATDLHTESTSWLSDASDHWHNCTVCGSVITTTKASHTAILTDTGDGATHQEICTICNTVIKDNVAHTFDQTKWSSNNTKHWHSCECGAKSDNEAHSVTTWPTQTNTSHSGNCSICNQGVTETHTYKYVYNDEINHTATCIKCNNTIQQAHTFVGDKCSGCNKQKPVEITCTINNDSFTVANNNTIAAFFSYAAKQGEVVIPATNLTVNVTSVNLIVSTKEMNNGILTFSLSATNSFVIGSTYSFNIIVVHESKDIYNKTWTFTVTSLNTDTEIELT